MSKKIQKKKCNCCSNVVSSDDLIIYNKKTYCSACYDVIHRDATEYKKLIKYICEIFDIPAPTGFILKQIKNMKTKNNWNYGAILYTLWYYFEILEKQLYLEYGIGFVERYYDQAREFYNHQEQLKQTAKRLSNKTVPIRLVKSNIKKSDKPTNNLININSLLTVQEGE